MQAKLALLSTLVLSSLPALAGEVEVSADARAKLAVSVYASGNAFVQEARRVQLPVGVSQVTMQEVSPGLNPASAWMAGEGIAVRSLDFLFDTLSPQSLLARSLGKTVELIRTNPATGAVTKERATILSVRNGVVLKIGERIETDQVDRLVFSELPEGLRAEPAVRAEIGADKEGSYDLGFSYQTSGLGWRAVYSAVMNEKGDGIDLDGFAIMSNQAGVRFKNATVTLLAGEPRRVSERPGAGFEEMQAFDSGVAPRAMMAKAAAPMPQVAEEDFASARAFRLPDPVTLEINQTKQVRLFRQEGVAARRDYLLDFGFDPVSARFDAAQPYETRPEIALFFDVPKERASLPGGVVRVYRQGQEGGLQLVGEDRLRGVAAGEKVKLSLGRAYDVSAKWRQTTYTMQSNKQNVFEGDVAWEVELQNARKEEVAVKISQPMTGQWSILDSNVTYGKPSARQAEWLVKIPAEGKTVLKVKAHFKN